jgi:hypothetical protein
MKRCPGTKRDNSPCTVMVEGPAQYCWWHDPANAEARKQAASRGGKRAGRGRPHIELQDIKKRLSKLADDVLRGDVEKSTGSVVSQILNVYLRALDVELKTREQLELIERLEALEQALEASNTGVSGGVPPWPA